MGLCSFNHSCSVYGQLTSFSFWSLSMNGQQTPFFYSNTSRWHAIFYCPQFVHVFFLLNNSSGNKWFNFKVPSWSIYTIIPFPTWFSIGYLRLIVLEFYHVLALGCVLGFNSISFFNLLIIFPNFLHIVSNMIWITTSFNCSIPPCMHTHPIDLMGIHFLHCTHGNPWCSSWHICCHCARCWLPHGMKIIKCASFNHVQLLLLMNW